MVLLLQQQNELRQEERLQARGPFLGKGATRGVTASGWRSKRGKELMDTEHPEHPTAPVGAPGPLRSH